MMIQAGTVRFNSGETPGYTLDKASGRFRSPDIQFDQPFAAVPNVVVTLSGLDSEHEANTRVVVGVEDVENEEFNITVSSWDDTLIYGVFVTWIAIGE